MAKKAKETADIDAKFDKLANDGEEVLQSEEQEDSNSPMYRVMADNKIPVSKKTGTLWKSRKQSHIRRLNRVVRLHGGMKLISITETTTSQRMIL